MNDIWQHISVGAMIIGAAVYVLRRSLLALRGRSSGCGTSCGSCPSNQQAEQVLVQLGEFPGKLDRPATGAPRPTMR